MKASVIITLYKNLPFLDLILQSLALQTEQNFEVIIAEDDNAPETIPFLEKQREKYCFQILHCSQDNIGFRKNAILNKAILKANADYLIMIDGDTVLHSKFIAEHLKAAKPNQTLIGRRLMLSESITNLALTKNDISVFTWKNFVTHKCKKLDCALYLPFLNSSRKEGIWGCNWSVNKNQILAINGFDEDYTKAGVGEDTDIEWRLRESGSSFKSVKFKAVQYHLHHKVHYSNIEVDFNLEILKRKKQEKNIICINGLQKEKHNKN